MTTQKIDRETRRLQLMADLFTLAAIGIFTIALLQINPSSSSANSPEGKPLQREVAMQIVVPSVDAAHWIRCGTPEQSILVNAQFVELIPIIDGAPVTEPILIDAFDLSTGCLLYTSPSPRDRQKSRMPSSA